MKDFMCRVDLPSSGSIRFRVRPIRVLSESGGTDHYPLRGRAGLPVSGLSRGRSHLRWRAKGHILRTCSISAAAESEGLWRVYLRALDLGSYN